jgi:hypothetical protein
MPTPHFGFYPPAGEVIDASNSSVTWNGREWRYMGKTAPFSGMAKHRLIGRPGGSLDGWYFDFGQGAWMEPDRAPSLRPSKPWQSKPQPQPQPQPPAPMPEEKEPKAMEKQKPQNVLEYLVKHPVAPLVGGFVLIGSMLADEPQPPQIPAELPEPTAKQWQMIYAQNLERFRRRMALFETIGTVLLGYADTNAVLAALPAKKAA